jgi:thiol:disulfide interchange protein
MTRTVVIVALVAFAASAFGFIGFLKSKESEEKKAVAGAAGETTSATTELWTENLEEALERAKASGKPVLIDFMATWCPPCKMLEKNTFSHPDVQAELANYEAVKIDIDLQPRVAAKYQVAAVPTLMCLDPSGEQKNKHMGYVDPEKFIGMLKQCAN